MPVRGLATTKTAVPASSIALSAAALETSFVSFVTVIPPLQFFAATLVTAPDRMTWIAEPASPFSR